MYRLLVAFLLLSLPVGAQDELLRFRIFLTDKHGVAVNATSVMLSDAALQRRVRQGIELDSTDLPVYDGYIQALQNRGLRIISRSKWMNTVVVSVTDSSKMDSIGNFPFVKSSQMVWMKPYQPKRSFKRRAPPRKTYPIPSLNYYGKAETPIQMLGLDGLHTLGFRGEGMLIAVLDGGFHAVDSFSWFSDLKLEASRDFVYPASNIFTGHAHGTAVLSIMASNTPFVLMGSAPEARYCLLRTEDVNSEFPIEEDYWTAAAEFADSIGADVLNASIGYKQFESSRLSYSPMDMDGKTAFITRAATMAASKGMLVVASAGNDGERTSKRISAPSDSPDVLSIGSVQSDLTRSTFSSIGPSADGRIKPDLVTMGQAVSYVTSSDQVSSGYGTSFSAPLFSGMAACLWQALPSLTCTELRAVLKESGDRFDSPNNHYGFGIPNVQRAYLSVKYQLDKAKLTDFYAYYSSQTERLHLVGFQPIQKQVRVIVYDLYGQKRFETPMHGNSLILDVQSLPNSIYLINFVVNGNERYSQKFEIRR